MKVGYDCKGLKGPKGLKGQKAIGFVSGARAGFEATILDGTVD